MSVGQAEHTPFIIAVTTTTTITTTTTTTANSGLTDKGQHGALYMIDKSGRIKISKH